MTWKSIGVLVLWIALTFVAPALGFRAKPDEWFASLTKPGFNPPSWVFAPVWTILYLLMAIATWLVWRQGGWERQTFPLSLYLVQLVLNAAWTPLFFGAHRIGLALIDIVLQWLAIAATLFVFARVDALAAWLFVPYLAWVSFATVLNFEFWRRNA
ncbi:MAG: TspO/MBR family protein [Chthoniobacterales bacterium]